MICLDNSVFSRFASPADFPAVDEYLQAHAAEPWTIPATVADEYYAYFDTQAEIREQQRNVTERLDGVLPLTDAVAAEAAQMQVRLDEHGITLNTADLLHAATAREAGATFVTRDAADFESDVVRELLPVDVIYS